MPSNHVIVPLQEEFSTNLSARIVTQRELTVQNFSISGIETSNFAQGARLDLAVQQYTIPHNLNLTVNNLDAALELLADIESKGFYTITEKQALIQATSLLELAKEKFLANNFRESYADIRESYLNIVNTNTRLNDIVANSVNSVFILIVSINMTAMVLAYLLCKNKNRRYFFSIILFVPLFILLYNFYPGFQIIQLTSLFGHMLISLGITFGTTLILPSLTGEKITSIFALAKANLLNRKLRFLLTLLSVMILIISFVSLTSFTTGYGLVTTKSWTLGSNPQGLLVKQSVSDTSNRIVHFIPLESTIASYLKSKPEVAIIAPKMENLPIAQKIGDLSSHSTPTKSMSLSGIMGIVPSAEADYSRLDQIVTQGRFLDDKDTDAILISTNAANFLGLEVKDNVTLNSLSSQINLTIVGFLDDGQLRALTDFHGDSILPKKIVVDSESGFYYLKSCSPNEIVVAPFTLTSSFTGLYMSRIGIQLKDWSQASSFSRQIALERGLTAFYSTGDQRFRVEVGTYFEAKGTSIIIPWMIVILIMIMTVLNSIYEQRREIAILSSIGLNPSNIMNIFIAKGMITGIIGGGIGYLFGLGSYSLLHALSLVPQVQAKISAIWSLAAMVISMVTVVLGAVIAVRSSSILTPSLLRRWHTEEELTPTTGHAVITPIPIRVREAKVDSMFEYVIQKFIKNIQRQGIDLNRGSISKHKEVVHGKTSYRVKFSYLTGKNFKIGRYPFEIIAKQDYEDIYNLECVCRGDFESIQFTTTFVRLALIEWSSQDHTPRKQ
jgi:ABC-type lipoprotein release transport system permease subunit